MTAAALEALADAGPIGAEVRSKALGFLAGNQHPDGGFGEGPGEASNSDSTAWAIEGIEASGENPETWLQGSNDPETYLESLQQSDGSISYRGGEESLSLLNTAYATIALAGRGLPLAAVPRAVKPPSSAPEPAASSPGVVAGGGGDGAPLFSRPEPQSQGRTRGGVRVLGSRQRHAVGASSAPATTGTTSGESPASVTSGPALAAAAAVAASAHPPRSPVARRTPAASTSAAGGSGSEAGGEPQVSGLLLASARAGKPLAAAGAPGLRSAAAGEGSSALASALAILIFVLACAGMQIERHRPQELL